MCWVFQVNYLQERKPLWNSWQCDIHKYNFQKYRGESLFCSDVLIYLGALKKVNENSPAERFDDGFAFTVVIQEVNLLFLATGTLVRLGSWARELSEHCGFSSHKSSTLSSLMEELESSFRKKDIHDRELSSWMRFYVRFLHTKPVNQKLSRENIS